jgi:hypothetical protein
MILDGIIKKSTDLITDNAPAILTGVGVVGTIGTAVLTGRASIKAHQLCQKADMAYAVEHDGHGKLDSVDKVKITWKLYVPPVAAGAATITCILMAQRLNAQQITAMAALYGLSQDRFQEYREKVAEQFGLNKEQKVRDAAAQDLVKKTEGSQVIILGEGEVLCFDKFTGRYFRSTMDRIKKAENAINRSIYNYDYASLSQFYEDAGLEPTSQSDAVGWNSGNLFELEYSAVLTDDERPCISIDFKYAPRTDYINGR